MGKFERSKKGSVTFSRVHLTTQTEAAQPQTTHVSDRELPTHSLRGSLLSQPFPAGTSQRCCSKCEMWVQAAIHRVCTAFFVSVGGTSENGSGTAHPSQMLNAIPGDRNIISPEKHSF